MFSNVMLCRSFLMLYSEKSNIKLSEINLLNFREYLLRVSLFAFINISILYYRDFKLKSKL